MSEKLKLFFRLLNWFWTLPLRLYPPLDPRKISDGETEEGGFGFFISNEFTNGHCQWGRHGGEESDVWIFW